MLLSIAGSLFEKWCLQFRYFACIICLTHCAFEFIYRPSHCSWGWTRIWLHLALHTKHTWGSGATFIYRNYWTWTNVIFRGCLLLGTAELCRTWSTLSRKYRECAKELVVSAILISIEFFNILKYFLILLNLFFFLFFCSRFLIS